MKIALCISGQPRFFEKGYNHIKKNIIDVNKDVDIFLHFWFDKNEINNTGYSNTSKTYTNNNSDNIQLSNIEKIRKMYNPQKMSFEKQYDFNYFIKRDYSSNVSSLGNPFAIFSQYYSAHRSIILKNEYELENGLEYDVVIKCRYDLNIDKPLKITSYDEKLLYFHNDIKNSNETLINDGMYFGNNENMTKVLENAYLCFDDYWLNGVRFGNHVLLGTYLDNNNINYKKINMGNIKWIRN